jgi:hypothetical protein
MDTIEVESSWCEMLSDAHRQYILAWMERAQANEQAAIDAFLKEK